ncbi:transglycosylase domain-containing protein [Oryzomicrobium sp.]|uniref:transglycosylase domain-containing protein n=1 Tax=Oryzomicrobium sp. TaxID=1911578 RepID=UPI0025CD7866|nr:transglycosylase domain-containing protein [Oryzomicrobium sp.]MCE1241838.1 transglycosylase domain-containing protein [Oryzomicrobium sp.]
MNAIGTIRQLSDIFKTIERGDFLPLHTYHVRGRKGKLLGIVGNGLCYPLQPSRNSELLKKWLLEVEDKRFYQHGAIDFKGVARAFFKNLIAGKLVQGGSTITQQLARTLFLDPSRTWVRKLSEAVIALKLERHLTKDQILNAYCDFSYMGRGSRGFEAAARIVYRKSFKKLEPDQIPALIGLLGAPERFHPENNEDRFWMRAKQKARTLGVEIVNASVNPIRILRTPNKRIESAVKDELVRAGFTERDIKAVELTLDESLQRSIDQLLMEVSRRQEVAQVAAIVICNKTGDILAESSWSKGQITQFSPSFSGCIQPGSTFKTFALLTAIEYGLSTETTFESAPYHSENKAGAKWQVRNYGHAYHGCLTLEEALKRSDNSVFARLADCLDQDLLASTYERFSLINRSSFTTAATLGGVRDGVSLLKLASAYASIARNGVTIEPRLVRFVEYEDGQTAFVRPSCSRVVADYAAIQTLKQVLAYSGIRTISQNISGKSGTTKKSSLFAGYNDDVSISLWLNFNHEQPEHGPKDLTAIQIVKNIGKSLLEWSENRAFSIV